VARRRGAGGARRATRCSARDGRTEPTDRPRAGLCRHARLCRTRRCEPGRCARGAGGRRAPRTPARHP
jgi:hypothetical protein